MGSSRVGDLDLVLVCLILVDFLPVLLKQAGIVSGDRQRVLNLVNSVTSMVGALTGTAIVDHVGRRPLLITASFCCTAGMGIVAGLLSPAGPQSTMRANAGISFICKLQAVAVIDLQSFSWCSSPLVGPPFRLCILPKCCHMRIVRKAWRCKGGPRALSRVSILLDCHQL